MNHSGNPLNIPSTRLLKPTDFASLTCGFVLCGLFISCRPAPDAAPQTAVQKALPATNASSSVVPIPEEFLTPPPASQPKPAILPRVVFATSDFQVTTNQGIQGIRAGEALNFVREEEGDYVVQLGEVEFKKNKSYFAATYVEPPHPSPSPVAGESAPVAQRIPEEAPAPDEPPLSGTVPADDPALMAEAKKVGGLTESIRGLNDQIRSAEEDLDKNSNAAPKVPTAEIKKASRAIQNLKDKRDELSRQLTEIGKP